MIQLCLRSKITACSLNEALAEAMSFMPNQAAKALATMNGTQMKPTNKNHSKPVALIGCGSPPSQPNTPAVMAIGTTNCTTLTPRLPRPALRASALPFSARGKKNEMFDIDEVKLPPPKPQSSVSTRKIQYGGAGCCTA